MQVIFYSGYVNVYNMHNAYYLLIDERDNSEYRSCTCDAVMRLANFLVFGV